MDTCKLTELCRIQYGYAFDSASFTEDASFPPLVRIRDVKRGFSETYYSGNYSQEYIVRRDGEIVSTQSETVYYEDITKGIYTYCVVAKNADT